MPGTWEILRSYAWPGNVRELKHVLEHAFVQCKGSTITPEELPADIREVAKGLTLPLDKKSVGFHELEEALTRAGGNKAKAARLLGISRPTLYRLLDQFNLMEV